MGRFYTEYTNRRHKTYGAQILEGDGVHTRGWDAGARVTMRAVGPDGAADAAEVYMTWGSHDSGTAVLVGTVYDTPGGPVWVPAQVPAQRKRRIMPAGLRTRSPRRPPRRAGTPASQAHSPAYTAAAEANQEDPDIPAGLPAGHRTAAGRRADAAVFGPEY
jgi:hypothetical protein